jgi:hypothetical protein
MDCRRFRNQHALLVDERCSAVQENEMRDHMRACSACARLDAAVRRSLLLARNLPDIQPSPDFLPRLEARLRAGAQPVELRRRYSTTAIAAVAATVVFAALATLELVRGAQPAAIQLPPVVATTPDADPSIISSALVATLPTGMSVWPAIVAATYAPVHFVAAEMADER